MPKIVLTSFDSCHFHSLFVTTWMQDYRLTWYGNPVCFYSPHHSKLVSSFHPSFIWSPSGSNPSLFTIICNILIIHNYIPSKLLSDIAIAPSSSSFSASPVFYSLRYTPVYPYRPAYSLQCWLKTVANERTSWSGYFSHHYSWGCILWFIL